MLKEFFMDVFFRLWYAYISRVDKKGEVMFMNYGFSGDAPSDLEAHEETDRYSIQLYHFVASAVDLKGKDLLEVGCGRGGGLHYVARRFQPGAALGLDLEPLAVAFCNARYAHPGLSFREGNAQALPLDDETFDFVINVESSHRYNREDIFFQEVFRILRPGGYFVITDFRNRSEVQVFDQNLAQSGFELVRTEGITPQVLKALQLDDSRKRALIKKLIPRILHNIGNQFAATVGSPTYRKFETGDFEYVFRVLRKPSQFPIFA